MNPTQDCGRSIEDLSDYLELGDSQYAEHIEHCPQCRARLKGLRSLASAASFLQHDDVQDAANDSASWLDGMLSNLRLETRAGRSIPLAGGPLDSLTQTEGSVLALIRAVGDSLGGMLIGRCQLMGDVTLPDAPIEVNVNVSARYGLPMPELAETLRRTVKGRLLAETELNVVAVNVSFTDVLPPVPNSVNGGEV